MLILDRSQTRELLRLGPCIDTVEAAFARHGRGETLPVSRMHVESGAGVFHVTAGGLDSVFGIKSNGRFPPPGGEGGQRVSGAMLLQDAASGRPLALLDSQVITVLRTAAATAVAVRHLARPGSRRALLVGAGRQAPAQVEALATVLRLEQLAVWDVQPASAERLAGHASSLGVPAHVPPSAAAGAQDSDVIVTVTPALAPVLRADEVPPGALVVAIGADGPGKQEHEPALLARSKVVVDVLEQAATSGELAYALAAGLMAPEDVYAELGEIVAGAKPGRTSDGETIVFDATGTALQDVAAALVIVEAARARGVGLEVALDE